LGQIEKYRLPDIIGPEWQDFNGLRFLSETLAGKQTRDRTFELTRFRAFANVRKSFCKRPTPV
jgi:hypothetical protein